MAWIEVHQALVTHRKLKALARALHVRRAVALGHLVCLWLWALDNAPDGDLTDIDLEDIREAADWPKPGKVLTDALVLAGFLDSGPRLTIHDWDEYAGRLIGKRAANTKRMRDARAIERAAHVQGLPTVPNQPSQNSTSTSTQPPSGDLQRCVIAFDGQSPLAINPSVMQQFEDWLDEGVPVEWIEKACREAAENGGRKPIKYVKVIVDRYVAQQSTDDKRPSKNGTSTDPELAEYKAAKSRGTNSGAGLVIFTMSDQAIIDRYDAKQREVTA